MECPWGVEYLPPIPHPFCISTIPASDWHISSKTHRCTFCWVCAGPWQEESPDPRQTSQKGAMMRSTSTLISRTLLPLQVSVL